MRARLFRSRLTLALSCCVTFLALCVVPQALSQARRNAAASAPPTLPVGTVLAFAGKTPPVGFLLCDGREVPKAQYRRLYEAIGTVYGGDGVNQFRLPDLQGRTLIGAGHGVGLSDRKLGANVGGEEQVTLTIEQMPVHSHIQTRDDSDGTYPGSGAPDANPGSETAGANNGTTRRTGGGGPHNNMPPFLALNYMIKF